jgi:hypothetical protein
MIQKIKNMQEVVTTALEKYAHLRDDDNRLVAYIWWKNLKDNNIPEDIITMDFLQLYASNQLPQADVITRARRKVQEDNPKLRGKLWNERHQLKEEVKNNINH